MIALVETGRTEEAARLADSFALGEHHSWELNRFLYARGVLRSAQGDHAGALDDFLECGRRADGTGRGEPVVTPWRTAAAECRSALGRPQEALTLAREELRLAQVWDTPRPAGGRCAGSPPRPGAVAVWNSPTVPSASCGTPPRRPS